jgi:hypothetical protein
MVTAGVMSFLDITRLRSKITRCIRGRGHHEGNKGPYEGKQTQQSQEQTHLLLPTFTRVACLGGALSFVVRDLWPGHGQGGELESRAKRRKLRRLVCNGSGSCTTMMKFGNRRLDIV